ncbi:hypothetical protein [Pseudomonas sichuanensis]|uniref:hypothetical protein n=1 Tax=Pseudomonas TaxID=286 RepID=UPI0036E28B75
MNMTNTQYFNELLLLPAIRKIAVDPEGELTFKQKSIGSDAELILTMADMSHTIVNGNWQTPTTLALSGIVYLTGRLTFLCHETRQAATEILESDLKIALQLPGESNWICHANDEASRHPINALDYSEALQRFVSLYSPCPLKIHRETLDLSLPALAAAYDLLFTLLINPLR